MAEYIERDIFINNKLIPLVKQLDLCHPKQKKGVLMAIKELNNEPTADVVEVVRCKDCKHFYRDVYNGKVLQRECRLRSIGSGTGIVFIESETDFCSYGERKED